MGSMRPHGDLMAAVRGQQARTKPFVEVCLSWWLLPGAGLVASLLSPVSSSHTMWVIPVVSHSCSCQGAEGQRQNERAPSSQLTQLSQAGSEPSAGTSSSSLPPVPHPR